MAGEPMKGPPFDTDTGMRVFFDEGDPHPDFRRKLLAFFRRTGKPALASGYFWQSWPDAPPEHARESRICRRVMGRLAHEKRSPLHAQQGRPRGSRKQTG